MTLEAETKIDETAPQEFIPAFIPDTLHEVAHVGRGNSSYERSSDNEALRFIEERVDIEGLTERLKSRTFTSEYSRNGLEALARMVYEMRDRALDYDCIISDDSGGRLPSLVLKEVFDIHRAKAGLGRVPIFFVAGEWKTSLIGSRAKNPNIRPFLKEMKKSNKLGNKVLLSTEWVFSGSSISAIAHEFERLRIDYDIAAVSTLFDKQDLEAPIASENLPSLTGELIYGDKGNNTGKMMFWRNPASGVIKNKEKVEPHPIAIRTNDVELREEIFAARSDTKTIAQELAKLF